MGDPSARRSRLPRAAAWACALALLAAAPGRAAAQPAAPPAAGGAPAPPADTPETAEEWGLRERLTEREDKRRPLVPWHVDLAGRPLTIGGEYEVGIGALRRRTLGIPDDPHQPDEVLLEQSLELELFYSFGRPLSIFVQGNLEMQEDLLANSLENVSELFFERGEMWLVSEDIADSGISFDIGRLDFEDDRRWWWDVERDAARLEWETERFDLAVALAYELLPSRSDQSYVEPEDDGVLRAFGELSVELARDHELEVFLLHQNDHSRTEAPGDRVSAEREDDSDARLTWLGVRLMGAWDSPARGILGYWLDTGWVHGDEHRVDYEDLPGNHSEVVERSANDVQGWGLDVGANWIAPVALEPRLFTGFAYGSGDGTPDDGIDRAYRQTGLEENEAGFGGVERFDHYGVLLDSELSNLQIWTVGVGLSILRASSLDLVYHRYRLVERATELNDARFEPELTGEHRDLGQEVDLVLALEEWERFEMELVGAAFQAGRAFGRTDGDRSYGAFFAMRFAF